MSELSAPRILLTAPKSGSGKTLITCGILQALKQRGLTIAAFKCGPDYIDPMFHGSVLGINSRNLDPFFTEEETTRYLFARGAMGADLSVMEGVMGYYDGVAGISTKASAYDLACVTHTPVILIVDMGGMSLSSAALVKGFLEYRSDSNICGVILNRISKALYPRVKQQLEQELSVKVLGYVPKDESFQLGSRHLGLVTPDEISDIREKLNNLADVLEETLELDELIALAKQAPKLSYEKPASIKEGDTSVTLGIARDEAFCFYYQDNLNLLKELGAKLVFFSPLHDKKLPEGLDGLIFYGGYPELYVKELSENTSMRQSIYQALDGGMPHLAECGGFLYLHEQLEDLEGNSYPMVGTVKGRGFYTGKLGRFGYISIEAKKEQLLGAAGDTIQGHEFHYYDSTSNGEDFRASKPLSKLGWDCIHADEACVLGFPHLYYYSNPKMIVHFIQACEKRSLGIR